MAECYIHVLSPTERGGLTAQELLFAHMPCYFGLRDCNTSSKFTWKILLHGLANIDPFLFIVDPGFLPESCTLCWEVLSYEASYRQLPCGHIFHLPCIDHWLCNEDASCPLCRLNFYYLRRPRVICILENDPVYPKLSIGTHLKDVRSWLARKLHV